ncbi:LHCP [Ectocarpus sp. CCAP 1310/34]|nr:LHCP [Ectocarpus sp. CCAP 1310/34]
MKSVIAFSAVLASASAFVPSASFVGSRVSSVARPASSTAVSMAATDMVGASAPLGFFDPMGFSKGPAERLNAYRESELKHGRTAMLAVVGFLTQENWHPLYNGGLSSNPLKAITEVPPEGLLQANAKIAMFIGFLEYIISQIVAKPGYIPGDYVGANDLFSEEGPHSQWETYQLKELHNGRAAMMGIAGLVTHNLLTGGMPAFEQISRGVYSGGIH